VLLSKNIAFDPRIKKGNINTHNLCKADLFRKHGGKTGEELKAEWK
tara:strand:- start:540 stop:677 length:138 start_codon:yes stop_codon:yes gene_type:complete